MLLRPNRPDPDRIDQRSYAGISWENLLAFSALQRYRRRLREDSGKEFGMLVPGGPSRSRTSVEFTESGMRSSRRGRTRDHARFRLLPSAERRGPRRVGHHTLGEHQIRYARASVRRCNIDTVTIYATQSIRLTSCQDFVRLTCILPISKFAARCTIFNYIRRILFCITLRAIITFYTMKDLWMLGIKFCHAQ